MTDINNTFVYSYSQVRKECIEGLERFYANKGYPERKLSGRFFAKLLGVHPSLLCRAYQGYGSRRVRVVIAHLIGLKPSDIWLNKHERDLVLDDYDYEYGETQLGIWKF